MPHRVVILGGGFGGLYAAQSLRRAPVAVTLIDRRNFHLFQPLLYQVATGALSPGEIANDTLKHDFRHIDPAEAQILLLEGLDRVLPPFPPDLSAKAEEQLLKL